MATIIGSTNNSQWSFKLEAYELSWDLNSNSSVVRVDVYIGRTSSRSYCGGNFSGSVTVEGQTQNFSGVVPNPTYINGGSWYYTGVTKDFTVGHNSDGSKTTSVSASWSAYFKPTSASASGSVTLTTIPRASGVSDLTGYIESYTNIPINPHASFKHSVKIDFGSVSKWLQYDTGLGDSEKIFEESNTRPGFTIPASLYSEFTTERANGTIHVYTYSGGNRIGESTSTLTCVCNPALCNPQATATVVDTDPTILELTQNQNNIVRYRSSVKITPTIIASAPLDTKTTLKSKAINGNVFTTDSVFVVNPKDKSFTLKLVNSRNMTSEIVVEATGVLINYIPMTVNANFWRPEPTTGEIKISYSGNYYAGKFSEGVTNDYAIAWLYRKKGDSNWIQQGTLTPTVDTEKNTYSGEQSLGTIFDYREQYEFKLLYKDKTERQEETSIYSVSRGFPIFWWNENSVHIFNKLYVGDINVGGDTYSTKEIVIGTWIDGKPIYAKTIRSTKKLNIGENNISTGISNFDELINISYTFSFDNYSQRYSYFSGITSCIVLNNGTLRIVSTTELALDYIYYTIMYTKTTDKGTEE